MKLNPYVIALALASVQPAMANGTWTTVNAAGETIPAPQALTVPVPESAQNVVDQATDEQIHEIVKNVTGTGVERKITDTNPSNIRVREDQIVSTGPAVIPPSRPVIKALVDSKTEVEGTYFVKPKGPLGPSVPVANKVTHYDYLLQNGEHLILDSKIEDIKDLRNWVMQHPKQARILAFTDRWWKRLQPALIPGAIIAQRLIGL